MTEKPARLPEIVHIDKANNLRETLSGWMRKDKVLGELKGSDSDCLDFQKTLCKVLAINDFYYARCSDTISATDQINSLKVKEMYNEIKQNKDHEAKEKAVIELVNKIAKHRGQLTDGDIVFASKFAHFFIDDEAFPILDDNAESMIQYYFDKRQLGQSRKIISKGQRYTIFCGQFNVLRQSILKLNTNYQLSNKKLDHFLWLAGICEKLKQNPKAGVNPEFKEKFDNKDQLTMELFHMLFPDEVPPRKKRAYRKRAT